MHKYIKMWVDNYAKSGYPDQRAIEDFVECENTEVLAIFRAELTAIASSKYDPEILPQIIGRGRASKHNSYEEWAKIMLLWLANYTKK